MGKSVTYNDSLTFNYHIGKALVENHGQHLDTETLETILKKHPDRLYDDLIRREFDDIYYLEHENAWLDVVVQNITAMKEGFAQSLAWYALFQACLAKRPYNLFHRKNLYMRTARVARSFGNKTTWDQSFHDAFVRHVREINTAVFDNGHQCRAINLDTCDIDPHPYDLVYIDPPYLNARGVGVDYHGFYHFLEGMTDYPNWRDSIDHQSKHRRLKRIPNPWNSPTSIHQAFQQTIERFADCKIVISYRSDGIPSIDELAAMLSRFKSRVTVSSDDQFRYVLSTNKKSKEILLIGT
jgi:adenine-specific DNA methylase